jgi:hypothetical protein
LIWEGCIRWGRKKKGLQGPFAKISTFPHHQEHRPRARNLHKDILKPAELASLVVAARQADKQCLQGVPVACMQALHQREMASRQPHFQFRYMLWPWILHSTERMECTPMLGAVAKTPQVAVWIAFFLLRTPNYIGDCDPEMGRAETVTKALFMRLGFSPDTITPRNNTFV